MGFHSTSATNVKIPKHASTIGTNGSNFRRGPATRLKVKISRTPIAPFYVTAGRNLTAWTAFNRQMFLPAILGGDHTFGDPLRHVTTWLNQTRCLKTLWAPTESRFGLEAIIEPADSRWKGRTAACLFDLRTNGSAIAIDFLRFCVIKGLFHLKIKLCIWLLIVLRHLKHERIHFSLDIVDL